MIGNTLSHYKIIEKLGQGGMGEVYLAEDSRLDRKVALKILPEHLSDRAELRERFEREARAVSSLNHRSIWLLSQSDNLTILDTYDPALVKIITTKPTHRHDYVLIVQFFLLATVRTFFYVGSHQKFDRKHLSTDFACTDFQTTEEILSKETLFCSDCSFGLDVKIVAGEGYRLLIVRL